LNIITNRSIENILAENTQISSSGKEVEKVEFYRLASRLENRLDFVAFISIENGCKKRCVM